jgi:hypothetical protein
MADPVAPSLIYITQAGIVIAGVATGLDPVMLGAGMCGGYWAVWRGGPMSWLDRTSMVVLSSLVAAWGAAVLVKLLSHHNIISESAEFPVAYVSALFIGRLAMPVLEKSLLDIVKAGGRAAVRWLDNFGARND